MDSLYIRIMIMPTVDANVWGWRWLKDVASVFFIKLCNKFLFQLNAIILTIMDINGFESKVHNSFIPKTYLITEIDRSDHSA